MNEVVQSNVPQGTKKADKDCLAGYMLLLYNFLRKNGWVGKVLVYIFSGNIAGDMIMNTKILKKMILVSLVALFVLPVVSQSQDVTEQLRARLEQTDEIIERAREAVQTTNSPHAKVAYDQAVALQKRAWQLFLMGPGNYRYINADKLTRQARKKAGEALKAARITSQSESAVLQRLERAEGILDRIRQIDGGENRPTLVRLYETARNHLDLAWEFYRSGKYKPAYKMANQVINGGEKLLKQINRYVQNRNNYDRRFETVREYLERADGVVVDCNSEKAQRLLEQAKETFQRAESLAAEGQYNVALRNLKSARDMAGKAIRECKGVRPLEQRYERLKARTDRLRDKVQQNDDTGQRLLAQTYEQLRLAREHYDNKMVKAASAALKAAQLTLGQLEKHLRSNGL